MQLDTTEQVYTFLGVRTDGTIPVVDIWLGHDDAAALMRASGWLQEHATCAAVEVWRDSAFVGAWGNSAKLAHRSTQVEPIP